MKSEKVREPSLKEALQTFNNRESYVSITLGFFVVLFIGFFIYKYFPIKSRSKVQVVPVTLGQGTGQVAGEQDSAKEKETYTVKQGDTVWKIAMKVYNNGFDWKKIAKENNLKQPYSIHVGNKLIIPR